MKELIFYNNVVTTSQRQQIEGYLAWKWGFTANLTSDHPYIVSPSSTATPSVTSSVTSTSSPSSTSTPSAI